MPGGDRTGSMGAGPMTGRGAGYCGGFGKPGYANPGGAAGFGIGGGRCGGWGGGWGRHGHRHRFLTTGLPGWARFGAWTASWLKLDPDAQMRALRGEAETLRSELEIIEKRIGELESENGAEK